MPPPPKPTPDPLQETIALLRAMHERAEVTGIQTQELLATNRTSLEQLAERFIEATERRSEELTAMLVSMAREPREIVILSPAEDPANKEQRLQQKQLVLSYNAFRTMLGRAPSSGAAGAAAVFMAARVDEQGDPDDEGESIMLLRPAPFASAKDGWTLVAFTSKGETLTAQLGAHKLPLRVQVPHLAQDIDIRRLEIRGANGDPLYLGVGPATQTQNAQRRQDARQFERAQRSSDLDR